MKDHLLGRLLKKDFDGDEGQFSAAERNTVRILDNRIYLAKLLRINYTTYNVRRDQDSMNPRTHSDVMVLSSEKEVNAHPYRYAHVMGIFHARIIHVGPDSRDNLVQNMEFLWVRWYGQVPGHNFSLKDARLPKIGFVPDTDDQAFGFLDPSLVIRGRHLIPTFAEGQTTELLNALVTAGRRPGETHDWVAFYVMM